VRSKLVPLGPEAQLVEEMRLRFNGVRCTLKWGCERPAVGYFIELERAVGPNKLVQMSSSRISFSDHPGDIGYVKFGQYAGHDVEAGCTNCIESATGVRIKPGEQNVADRRQPVHAGDAGKPR